jgi:hypothetical protein
MGCIILVMYYIDYVLYWLCIILVMYYIGYVLGRFTLGCVTMFKPIFNTLNA